jgi:ribose transport system permease protein
VNLVITDGGTVSGLPRAFGWLGQGYILGIPVPVALFAIVGPGFGYILANHRYVQQAYFIGGNLRSAQISGIDVEKFRVFVFMLSAALAGVAGIITASQYGAANMAYGQNAELRVIASVVIGGTNLLGGSGTIAGTALGVLFLATVYNAFTWTGINTYWQEVIIGSMLLIAVFVGQFVRGRQR